MAGALYRVGRWAFRHRRLVIGAWLAAVVLAFVAAAVAPSAEDEDLSMPGTESQRAVDLLDQRFPQAAADGAEARLVFRAPAGEQITAHRAAVEASLGSLAGGDQVVAVTDPFEDGDVSQDGTTAYAIVPHDVGASDLTDSSKHDVEEAAESARAAGLTAEIGGDALDAEVALGGTTELVGLSVAAVVLVITLGSLAAAGLSLLTATAGVAIAFGAIAVLAQPLGLTSTVAILALMLGLAVGIDYALFVTSRYRDELGTAGDAEEAAGRAVARAGSAVVFAGATVVIALLGLGLVGIPELTKMGMGGAGAVILAVLVALTLVPALLGAFGRRVLARSVRRATGGPDQHAPALPGRRTAGTRWARLVVRRPLPVLLAAGLGLAAVAVPTVALELGLPGDESKPTETTQRRAYDLMSEGFGPGTNGPLTVVVDLTRATDGAAAVDGVVDAVDSLDGVASTGAPVLDPAGDTAVLTVVPTTAPTSAATKDLVQQIRDVSTHVVTDSGAEVFVTGRTALNIDISQAMSDALLPYLVVVVGLAVLLLSVVFRSVLVPVLAALGFLLSVGAAFGVLVAVCQWGWGADLIGMEQTGPVMSLMPILIIGVVFGLAMDYQVFLFTRVREAHVHGLAAHEALVQGFRHSARVVTAAAVIMFSVFAGFVGVHSPTIQTMGIGLALAVVFDAFVVRMALIPAVLALVGERAWWLPRILDRVLPTVDIEGGPAAPSPDRGPTAPVP